MILSGQHLIAGEMKISTRGTFYAVNPVTGERLDPDFYEGAEDIVADAAKLADLSFDILRVATGQQRSDLLEAVAEELLVLKQDLCERARLETGLPQMRLDGELGRTVNQLRMFAQLVRVGGEMQTVVEAAIPERQPAPKPDLRLTHRPLGPVAVFGASNFPLAFSVAGGDTAAALAAGCPVLVKGHPAHPGTSELAGRAIQKAIQKTGLPAGIFSLIHGQGQDIGQAMVQHPLIKAVAFTGSLAGGRALFDQAAKRPEPIPVFAEMGSVNPVFLLPGAVEESGLQLAEQFAASLTLGVGQFCTNPGLLIAIKSSALDKFLNRVNEQLNLTQAMPMLHVGIKKNFVTKLEHLATLNGVEAISTTETDDMTPCFASPVLLQVGAQDFLNNSGTAEEVFGPSSLVVRCENMDEMISVAKSLNGQLTATVHAVRQESSVAVELFSILEKKAGRLIYNNFPTGVEVCPAIHHGGPYPATTDSRFSSVGTSAIKRFLRPLCYQNFPLELLPEELKETGNQG